MTTEPNSNAQGIRKPKVIYRNGASGAVYGFRLNRRVGLLSHPCRHVLARCVGNFQGHRLARDAGL